MAKPGAQLGNNNASSGTQFRDALHKALIKYSNSAIKSKTALSHIAKSLIAKAIEGDNRSTVFYKRLAQFVSEL